MTNEYDPLAFQRSIDEGKIWIKPDTFGLVRFKPNESQKKIYACIARNRAAGNRLGSRILNIKGRQPGSTTGAMAFTTIEHKEQPTHQSIVAAHDKDTIRGVWEMYRRADVMYGAEDENALQDRGVPKGQRRNDDFLQNAATGSRIYIERAEGNLARGRNPMHVHLSEIDYWDGWNEPWDSLQPCIVKHPMSVTLLETTLEDREASEWRDFIEGTKEGNTNFEILFLSWLEVERYRIPLSDEAAQELELQLDDEEREIMDLYGADLEQMAWRRESIAEVNGNIKRFRQTYPICLDEALETKSARFYERESLEWHAKHLRDPIASLYPELMGAKVHMRQVGVFGEAALEIYERPIGGHSYVLGADCADSEQAGTEGSENYLVIVDAHSGTVVAQWHAHTNLYQFAEVIKGAAQYYNNALCNIEANQGGGTVINRLHKDLNYHRIAMRTHQDRRTGTTTELMGFRSDRKTREMLIDLIRECVNTGKTTIPNKYMFDQHKSFSARNALQQKRQSRGATKDDGVIAHALALIGCQQHMRDKWIERINITTEALSEQGLLENLQPGIIIYDRAKEESRWRQQRMREAYGDLYS